MDATKARTDDASLAKTLPSEYVFTSDTDRDNTASAAAIARVEAAQKTKWTRLFHNPKLIFIAFFAS